jgi:hypothetical protein
MIASPSAAEILPNERDFAAFRRASKKKKTGGCDIVHLPGERSNKVYLDVGQLVGLV